MTDSSSAEHANHLHDATSPYLLQHAHNPVEWYPWGEEALARAVREDRPILLSVGYSACHWCHVMAHESFEDPKVAAMMNGWFVNIKVDREERPDIDDVYQKVLVLMGEGGGWPLTIFLLPDQRPIYGGTYFPPVPRYGRASFPKLLAAIHDLWTRNRQDALAQADAFMDGFRQIAQSLDEGARSDLELPDPRAFMLAANRLASGVDPKWGGFGGAPKFPNVPSLRVLLAASVVEPEGRHAEALLACLDGMMCGGIYDHLRGGFARYSVDRMWHVPHFEKMLYDNALLLGLYARASTIWPHRGYERVVSETVDYLVADMREDVGTFHSATDADSEGVEGKYFCWTMEELRELLGDDAERFAAVHEVTEGGNFEHGMNVLHLAMPLDAKTRVLMQPLRERLLAARMLRVPPARDEKIVTAWNGLLVSAFVEVALAARVRGDRSAATRAGDLAAQALAGLFARHVDRDGVVLRAAYRGRAHTRGFLEDLAALGLACLDLHMLDLDPLHLQRGSRLATRIVEEHARSSGGFHTSSSVGEPLIERSESQHDSPLPSGTALAVDLLFSLDLVGGCLLDGVPGGARAAAEPTLARFAGAHAQPSAHAGLVLAARLAGASATGVRLRGPTPESVRVLWEVWLAMRERVPFPMRVAFERFDGTPSAIVCRGLRCHAPVSDPGALRDLLLSDRR